MGKATIVSVCPFRISEHKAMLTPCTYTIPAVEEDVCSVLQIGDAFHMVILDVDRPPLRMTAPADEVARSVINDYAVAQIGYAVDRGPGLFYLEGHLFPAEIERLHPRELKESHARQDRWFRTLILQADDEWMKFHQHRMITDTQRTAARYMKLKRDWTDPIPQAGSVVECPVCTSQVPARALMCANCRAAMPGKEEELKRFTFLDKPTGTVL